MTTYPTSPPNRLFLPDFCSVKSVFFGIILTELLAFVLVLAPLSKIGFGWGYALRNIFNDLALVSLFMQWITLCSMAMLCLLKDFLSKLGSNKIVGIVSYFIILIISLLVSETAWFIEESLSQILGQMLNPQHYWLMLQIFAIIAVIDSTMLGYFFYKKIGRKAILVLIYASILLAALILSELIAFLLTPFPLRYIAEQHLLFLLRNLAISAIISAIALRYLYIQYNFQQESNTNAHAHIQALQSRIRPHFLFNSMNTIASLIRFQPKEAEQAVEDFAELFRVALSDASQRVALEDELELCEQYLRIETLRLGDRLRVEWRLNNVPEDALIPSLTLQPLLENAVYYGIQPALEGGTIVITGLFDGTHIRLDIESPLLTSPKTHQGNGIGQENIQRRLTFYYGSQAKLTRRAEQGKYCISLRFPYEKET
ncbi:sensor histidine kinase [Beggiatoa leptomitoformis]|uniref:Sensor histidine kinase n=1 Tax=Beggiatoa leptomitoformis TaxID=288004 RepID=A0A2N9YH21_9GAMM|nr:histidine kinase [Beggiatoa leptomitoformis]AUI69818.1 sensor histidine kinase [Beggiatoa leptomitoformis]QGX03674.1 sensor histidine kinase [Beggiatoa leptomitoformis]